VAESITFSLRSRGHKVFLDRDDLPPGQSYDQQIERAVADSDVFIFLVTPESVTKGRYTLTELTFARRKWRYPHGHVLPVMARKTPFDEIPPYLKAVIILEPLGNITAETAAQVDSLMPLGVGTSETMPTTPGRSALSRPSVQLGVVGLALSTILQALGIVGTPFGMGQNPTDIGTLATVVPIAIGAIGATGAFEALANRGRRVGLRPSVQLSVVGLAVITILQTLDIVGTPFGMGARPTEIGTYATLVPIATGAIGATGAFEALANIGVRLLREFRRPKT